MIKNLHNFNFCFDIFLKFIIIKSHNGNVRFFLITVIFEKVVREIVLDFASEFFNILQRMKDTVSLLFLGVGGERALDMNWDFYDFIFFIFIRNFDACRVEENDTVMAIDDALLSNHASVSLGFKLVHLFNQAISVATLKLLK